MVSTSVAVLLGLTGVTILFHRVGMWAVFRYMARPPRARVDREASLPALTLLKPLKGLEDSLEQNLISFYAQDYPAPLEIVFATTDAADAAIPIARAVAARYPQVATQFVVSRSDFGLNPKVANLAGALAAARNDCVLQSDANVRVVPGYLRALVEEMQAEDAALIGSVVVGVAERTPAAALENLQLSTFISPGLCMAKELAGITCVLGKAMLFRRSELEVLGGLAHVKDILAEDYVLVQLYERAGKRAVLSTRTVENVNANTRLPQFLGRHSRWLKMRAVVSALGFAADLGSNPFPFALGAWLASGCDWRLLVLLACVYVYKCHWDRKLLLRFRGHGLGRAQLWATPARDLLLAAIWCYALFSRSTEWRGQRLRLGRGSRLIPDEGSRTVRLLKSLHPQRTKENPAAID